MWSVSRADTRQQRRSTNEENETMVEHVVLFKLKPETTDEERAAACRALGELGAKVPGILDISCGVNFSTRNQGYDVGLVVKFVDRDALDVYIPHPAHREAVEQYVRPIMQDVIVVDYEI
jgi:hypothetical protein